MSWSNFSITLILFYLRKCSLIITLKVYNILNESNYLPVFYCKAKNIDYLKLLIQLDVNSAYMINRRIWNMWKKTSHKVIQLFLEITSDYYLDIWLIINFSSFLVFCEYLNILCFFSINMLSFCNKFVMFCKCVFC